MNNKNNGIWYRVWNEKKQSWVYGVPMYTKNELRVYTDPLNNPEEYVSISLAMAAFRYLEELPNGQSLYCGDIIAVTEYFCSDSFCFYGFIDDDGQEEILHSLYDFDEGFCTPEKKTEKKVIGNVVENPNLLEELKVKYYHETTNQIPWHQ